MRWGIVSNNIFTLIKRKEELNGRYNMEVLQEDRIMYRAGNVQNPYGRWFTSEDIMLCKLI